jgi:hypothetical protein
MNLSAALTDLGPVLLAVRVYGCAARPDLGALATKSSRAFGASSCPFLELSFP